jgi:hypothetical protein
MGGEVTHFCLITDSLTWGAWSKMISTLRPLTSGGASTVASTAAAATAATGAGAILLLLHRHSPEVILLGPPSTGRRCPIRVRPEAEGHAHAAVVDRCDLAGQLPNTSFKGLTRIARLGPVF